MAVLACHEAPYLRQRVFEEIDRSNEMGYQFAIAVAHLAPPSRPLARARLFGEGRDALGVMLRSSDVLAVTGRSQLAALLVEIDARAARSAVFRMRSALSKTQGQWELDLYHFPYQRELISRLPLLAEASSGA